VDSTYADTGNVSIGFANTSASHIASNSTEDISSQTSRLS
jgi:hypothetical protein